MNIPFIQVPSVMLTLTVYCQFYGPAAHAITIHFDQPEYIVSGPGEMIPAQILIDANENTPEDDPVPAGLFSFGTRANFNAAKARVNALADIVTVPELSFFGFDPGAFLDLGPGTAATKGNIDENVNTLVPYEGTVLATVTIENLSNAVDEYPLVLDFFNTLGPDENIFVDGNGDTLDDRIVFLPSVVRVVPEPGGLALVICVLLIPFRNRRSLRCENKGVHAWY